jgi:hypothetical protein
MAIEPLLRELWRQEAHNDRRHLLLTALAVAGLDQSDELLSQRLEARDADVKERALVLLILALGPDRDTAGAALQNLSRRADLTTAEQVGVALAMRRYRGVAPPERWFGSGDPGVAAAVRYCNAGVDDPRLDRWLRGDRAHAELVQRGFLLGLRSGPRGPAEMEIVRTALGRGDSAGRGLRRAAALCVRRSAAPESVLERLEGLLDAETTAILAWDPAFRTELARRGWLGLPPDRLSASLRGRTAVAIALSADGRRLPAVLASPLRRDAAAANAFCLGLAWRCLREPAAVPPDLIPQLPDVPSAAWVRLASGVEAGPVVFEDERLAAAFRLARAGRLPVWGVQGAIEVALWYDGAHPGLFEFETECEFVQDLLVAGSDYAGAVLRRDQRGTYLPDGIHHEDDSFFSIAYEISDYLRAPPPRVSERYRLQ